MKIIVGEIGGDNGQLNASAAMPASAYETHTRLTEFNGSGK